MNKIFYTRHDSGLTLFRDGKLSTVSSSNVNFNAILEALKRRDFEKVETLMNTKEAINKAGVSKKFRDCKVMAENGEIFWVDSHKRKQKIEGPLALRILNALGTKAGEQFADALAMFLDNIKKNKLKDIRAELYEWLDSGQAPITYDGCFLAYKKVKSNFKDIYTGKMDNSPGTVVRMKETDVDTNRNNHCSVGLHFCSRGYLSNYGSEHDSKIVIVKVNPRHVFAIPTDYQFQKGRASQYFVVGEYKGDYKTTEAFKDSFVKEDTKLECMPQVELIGWMQPSVKAIAKSFDLIDEDNKVLIATRRDRQIPVKIVERDGKRLVVDVLGTIVNVKEEDLVKKSFETKSVRELVKHAVRKADKTGTV